jgi:ATP-dependent Clp protease ATP-binding subunit ClpA
VLTAAIKMARSGLGNRASRSALPVRRPDRRRQDRGHAPAGDASRHRAGALRHVRIHGAHTVSRLIGAPPGLCRLRPGRPADRGGHQASAFGAAAGRDREGASGCLQPAAAGHGPRHADRHQRPQGDFRNVIMVMTTNAGAEQAARRSRSASPSRTTRRCDGGDQARLQPGVPQPPGRHHPVRGAGAATILRVVDKFLIELESQLEEQARHAGWLDADGRARWRGWLADGFDPKDGRAPDGARDPGR